MIDMRCYNLDWVSYHNTHTSESETESRVGVLSIGIVIDIQHML